MMTYGFNTGDEFKRLVASSWKRKWRYRIGTQKERLAFDFWLEGILWGLVQCAPKNRRDIAYAFRHLGPDQFRL